jgi:hypothetical protein
MAESIRASKHSLLKESGGAALAPRSDYYNAIAAKLGGGHSGTAQQKAGITLVPASGISVPCGQTNTNACLPPAGASGFDAFADGLDHTFLDLKAILNFSRRRFGGERDTIVTALL